MGQCCEKSNNGLNMRAPACQNKWVWGLLHIEYGHREGRLLRINPHYGCEVCLADRARRVGRTLVLHSMVIAQTQVATWNECARGGALFAHHTRAVGLRLMPVQRIARCVALRHFIAPRLHCEGLWLDGILSSDHPPAISPP